MLHSYLRFEFSSPFISRFQNVLPLSFEFSFHLVPMLHDFTFLPLSFHQSSILVIYFNFELVNFLEIKITIIKLVFTNLLSQLKTIVV